jgi:hypothetical protein
VILETTGGFMEKDHKRLRLTVTFNVDSRESCDLSR